MVADAYCKARAEVINEAYANIDDGVKTQILDDAISNGEYGYCGDCDRGCCDDCSSWGDGHDEGYDEGYLDALERNENANTGQSYDQELLDHAKRLEEAKKPKLAQE